MLKQSIPEVPQGLAPALNIFLRWVRDQLKGLAMSKVQKAAEDAAASAAKAQGTADSATEGAAAAQNMADSACDAAAQAQATADNAAAAAVKAQNTADSAGKTAAKAQSSAGAAQSRADEAYALAEDVSMGAVRFDTTQNLSNAQQSQARQNINAAKNAVATASAQGLMAAADKAKLDSIEGGAEPNVVETVKVNGTDLPVSGKAVNIALATVATTGSYNDLLNKPTIPAGGIVDSALSSTSTNPVQNKVIDSALASKVNANQAVSAVYSAGYVTSTYVAGATVANAGHADTADFATTASTASYLGSDTIGASGKPVYISSGYPVSMAVVDSATSAHFVQTEAASTNATRSVAFYANGRTDSLVYNDNFTYNPNTKALIVSGGTVTATTFSGTATNATSLGGVAAASYALDANVVHKTGNEEISGTKTFTNEILSPSFRAKSYYALCRDVNDSWLTVYGGKSTGEGAYISLFGKDTSPNPGRFILAAVAENSSCRIDGSADGTLTWGGKNIVTNGDDQTILVQGTGTIGFATSNTSSPRKIDMRTQDNGNAGIWDTENSRWMIYANNGAVTEIPGGLTTVAPAASDSSTRVPTTAWVRSNVVMSSGNQEIGGSLNLKKANPYLNFVETDWKKGTPQSSGTSYAGIIFAGSDSVHGGDIYFHYEQNRDSYLDFIVHKMNSASDTASFSIFQEFQAGGTMAFYPSDSNVQLGYGNSGNRWKQLFATTTTISTSDERLKTSITDVPDEVLDAWGDVNWKQFQMRDAVEKKGANARLHNGLIAQRIDEVFKAHGLDASRYGLFCHDEWEERPEGCDKDGNVIRQAEPAGDMYSLRYEEALCMEAAYQRRRADRMVARISEMERRLNEMEAVLASLIAPVGDETFAGSEEGDVQA